MNDDQASPHLNIGDVVDGRYELLEEIGEGGFATVYRARQRIIDRIIALKVLHIIPNPKRARAFAERFAYEARLAAQIQHPNVVTIHDFGFAGLMKQPYIAMEMLSGYGLDEELKRNGALEARRAFKLIRRALDAIRVGHRLGVVHKDLKPPNLFLCAPGTEHDEHLKILDFGVARLATEATSHTATGEVIGTPQYLAPEYILEQLVTPAFDVYQMGLILVEMLTGRKVVADANPYSCAMKHADGKIEVPDPLWHGALGPVLRRALARDHSKRFQDAGELLDALEGIDADRVKRDLERGYSGSTNLADDQKDPKSSTAPLRPDEPWLDRMADVAFASEPDADRDAPATDVMPTVDSDAIDDEQRTGERTEVHDTNAVARLLAKTVDGGGSSADGAPPPWAADLQRAMASPGGAQRSAEVAAAVERGAAAFAADATPGRLDPHKVEENFAAARRETEEKRAGCGGRSGSARRGRSAGARSGDPNRGSR